MSRSRRSDAVALGVTAILAAGLSGCGSSSPDYAGVCVDQQSQQRIDDSYCDGAPSTGAHGWYYYPVRSGGTIPRVGDRVSGGTFDLPSGKSVERGGFSKAGGKVSSVSRGGFGGRFFSHVGG